MSLFFYRKPDFIEKVDGPMNYVNCHNYASQAAACRNCIPDRLSFDNVLEGKTLPPCSLVDFMDYLVYISRDAENLQFLLWLRDYSKRFNELPETEISLSPEWKPDGKAVADLQSHAHSKLAGMKGESLTVQVKPSETPKEVESGRPSLDRNAQAQPFRAEVNLVIQHYLIQGAPRELNLSFRTRSAVLQALQHTTHPTAFAPVQDLTEQCLRNQSHPNFIRWAISNGRAPRAIILRQMCAVNFMFFIVGEILLILSSHSRWIRISLAPCLFFAIMMLYAVLQGFCMLLAISSEREQRPWELFADEEEAAAPINDPFKSHEATMPDSFSFDDLASQRTKVPSDAASQSTRTTGTLRGKVSRMNPFGPGNAFDHETWIGRWARVAWWRKGVWTFSLGRVPCLETGIHDIHKKVIWQSVACGGIATVAVTAVVVAMPEVGVL